MIGTKKIVVVACFFTSVGLAIAYGGTGSKQDVATFDERFPRKEEMMWPGVWVSTGDKSGYYARKARRSIRPWRNRAICAALPAARERAQCLRRYCRWRAADGVGCDKSPLAT